MVQSLPRPVMLRIVRRKPTTGAAVLVNGGGGGEARPRVSALQALNEQTSAARAAAAVAAAAAAAAAGGEDYVPPPPSGAPPGTPVAGVQQSAGKAKASPMQNMMSRFGWNKKKTGGNSGGGGGGGGGGFGGGSGQDKDVLSIPPRVWQEMESRLRNREEAINDLEDALRATCKEHSKLVLKSHEEKRDLEAAVTKRDCDLRIARNLLSGIGSGVAGVGSGGNSPTRGGRSGSRSGSLGGFTLNRGSRGSRGSIGGSNINSGSKINSGSNINSGSRVQRSGPSTINSSFTGNVPRIFGGSGYSRTRSASRGSPRSSGGDGGGGEGDSGGGEAKA